VTRPLALVAASVVALTVGHAQNVPPADTTRAVQLARPWSVGERLDYGVKFGFFNVGRAYMEVLGIDTIRGEPCFHVQFVIHGRTPFYTLNDSLQSWFGVNDLVSRRFQQDTEENGRVRHRHYDIYPEQRIWIRNDTDTGVTVAEPLDEASFFFFARSVPLDIGQTYSFARYFHEDRNPVTLRVLQRQTIGVPAGRFRTIAVQPIFKAKGLFGQGGQAVIWFSDDEARIPVRFRSSLPIGTLDMSLRSRR
jgi:hypothetical protein